MVDDAHRCILVDDVFREEGQKLFHVVGPACEKILEQLRLHLRLSLQPETEDACDRGHHPKDLFVTHGVAPSSAKGEKMEVPQDACDTDARWNRFGTPTRSICYESAHKTPPPLNPLS